MFAQFRSEHADLLSTLGNENNRPEATKSTKPVAVVKKKETATTSATEAAQSYLLPLVSCNLNFDEAMLQVSTKHHRVVLNGAKDDDDNNNGHFSPQPRAVMASAMPASAAAAGQVVSSSDQLAAAKKKRPPSPLQQRGNNSSTLCASFSPVGATKKPEHALKKRKTLPPPVSTVLARRQSNSASTTPNISIVAPNSHNSIIHQQQPSVNHQHSTSSSSRSPSLAPPQQLLIVAGTVDLPASVVARSASALSVDHQHLTHANDTSLSMVAMMQHQQKPLHEREEETSAVASTQHHYHNMNNNNNSSVLALEKEIQNYSALEHLRAVIRGWKVRAFIYSDKQATSIREQIVELDALARDVSENNASNSNSCNTSVSPSREETLTKFLGHGHLQRQRRALVAELISKSRQCVSSARIPIKKMMLIASFNGVKPALSAAAAPFARVAWWKETFGIFTGEKASQQRGVVDDAAKDRASAVAATAATTSSSRPKMLKRRAVYQPPPPNEQTASSLSWNQNKNNSQKKVEKTTIGETTTALAAASFSPSSSSSPKQPHRSSSAPALPDAAMPTTTSTVAAAHSLAAQKHTQARSQSSHVAQVPGAVAASQRRAASNVARARSATGKTSAIVADEVPDSKTLKQNRSASTAKNRTQENKTSSAPHLPSSTTPITRQSRLDRGAASGTHHTPHHQQQQHPTSSPYKLPPSLAQFRAAARSGDSPTAAVWRLLGHWNEAAQNEDVEMEWRISSQNDICRMLSVMKDSARTFRSEAEQALFVQEVIQRLWSQAQQ